MNKEGSTVSSVGILTSLRKVRAVVSCHGNESQSVWWYVRTKLVSCICMSATPRTLGCWGTLQKFSLIKGLLELLERNDKEDFGIDGSFLRKQNLRLT